MRYIYNRASLPNIAEASLRHLSDAADRLVDKLTRADFAKIDLSPHGRANLLSVTQRPDELMRKYVHILAWLLDNDAQIPEVFIDYGGGHGLLSALAREAGFPHVIYNDIFDGCCKDAEAFGRAIGVAAHAYVCGDIHSLRPELSRLQGKSCALATINVIEHIYDIQEFILATDSLTEGPMCLALSTSANPMNPIVRRRHFQQHRLWEYHDGPHEGCSPADSLRAFRSIRRDIIRETAPSLGEAEVEALTKATRGLKRDDIEVCVRDYLGTKRISHKPEHPTNTCDPLTGSWQERLLNIPAVTQMLERQGFSVRIVPGYCSGFSPNPVKRAVKQAAASITNRLISLLGSQGARLAPCFMFHARRAGRPAQHGARSLVARAGGPT